MEIISVGCTTLNVVFSVTYYVDIHKAIASHYGFHVMSTEITKGCMDNMLGKKLHS